MNITLIGMAGAGKSTVGKALAEKIDYGFIDIDDLLRNRFSKPLHVVIDEIGDDEFMTAEASAVISLGRLENTIISPGGSIIYSDIAMAHLKSISKMIFLDVSFETIESRVDVSTRGLIGMNGKTLKELYDERRPFYIKHASMTIDAGDREVDRLVEHILGKIDLPT